MTEMIIDFMIYVWNNLNQFDSFIFAFNNKIELKYTKLIEIDKFS